MGYHGAITISQLADNKAPSLDGSSGYNITTQDTMY